MFGFEAIATLLGAAGILALALAAVGVYGVAAQSVGAASGPKSAFVMALGAAPRDVLGLVLGRGVRLTLVGAVVGLVLALGAGQDTAAHVSGRERHRSADLRQHRPAARPRRDRGVEWFPASRAARLQPSSILRER